MSLLEFLKREPNARLIFGKRELVIIRRQLMGEQLKQSERNRLSKFIRPKLRFISAASKYEGEFKLERRVTIDNLIEKAKQTILSDKVGKKAKAILLFGSHVSGFTTFRSDVDVCALFDNIPESEAFKFQIRVSSKLPEIIDVRVFNTLPLKVKIGVISAFKVIFKARDFDPLFWTGPVKEASESRVFLYANTNPR